VKDVHLAGDDIRAHRRRLGLSQHELADRAQISVRALRDIEVSRVYRPHDKTLTRLADALGLPPPAPRDPGAQRLPHTGGTVRVDVLGPLRLRVGSTELAIASDVQRLILGLLALRAGQTVSIHELAGLLWPDQPPPTWRNLVHVYVSRLRAVTEPDRPPRAPGQVIVASHHGYQLAAEVDLARFHELTESAETVLRESDRETGHELYERALDCWRGPVLSGEDDRLRGHPAALAASRRRLSVTLALAAGTVETGQPARAKRWLQDLVEEEPLHEGLHAHLITALAATGEQAAALRLYSVIRQRLYDELGVDPGAELEAAHVAVLRAGVATPASLPRQLPAGVATFTGRANALRQLDSWNASGSTAIAITGGGGVGKTALAIRWARGIADRLGHGHLYVNLNGYGQASPMRPIEALSCLLRGLGVAGESVPDEVGEAAALYRTVLDGRPMLVLLDNASDAEQVRPLLPGGRDNVTVITSRDRLSGLVAAEGVRRLELGVLEPDEAMALIVRIIGSRFDQADSLSVAQLARQCAYLPLALCIAAANVADRRYGCLPDLVAELASRPWAGALEIDGDPQTCVAVAFDTSYARLDEKTKRLFRLVGLVPGFDFGTDMAAALAEEGIDRVREHLLILTAANLLDQPAPDRFAFHDLLRRYAIQLCRSEGDSLEPMLGRLYCHYLASADVAARAVSPQVLRLPVPLTACTVNVAAMSDPAAAITWFDTERANLIAAINQAPHDGLPAVSWLLSDAMRGYFATRRHMAEWGGAAKAAMTAAQNAGDSTGEVAARLSLSQALWFAGRRAEAAEHLLPAVDLAREIGWYDGAAACLGNLGGIHGEWGELETATAYLSEAVDIARLHGVAPQVTANNLTNLGALCADLGRLRDALRHAHRALAMYQEIGSRLSTAVVETNLGSTLLSLGRHDEAETRLASALEVFTELGAHYFEASARIDRARLRLETGRQAEARIDAQRALEAGRTARASNRISAALNLLGWIARDPAIHEEALREASGVKQSEAEALLSLAETLAALGQYDTAKGHAQDAVELARKTGFRLLEAKALTVLAEIYQAHGDHTRCRSTALAALAIHRDCGSHRWVRRTAALLNGK